MYTQLAYYLIQNTPAVKSGCGPKKAIVKKMWNPRWRPRNGCDGRLMAKYLIKTIQVNLCCLLHVSLKFGTKFTWIVVIKNFAISLLPSQPFLGHHLGFHILFTIAFLELHPFLHQGCFGLDFTSFCNCILCS